METPDGTKAVLPLSVFDVSTLVSMLYAARADALNQEPDTAPEVMLPLAGLSFGEDGESARQIMRVHTTPVLHQDFSPEPGSPAEALLRTFSDFLASQSGEAPVQWGERRPKH